LGDETNYFGNLTLSALEKFQATVGLTPAGFFGPQTRAYVNNLIQ
jgi:peptidoglycan hydrolase-like protein with peptidoglycan-binding domain